MNNNTTYLIDVQPVAILYSVVHILTIQGNHPVIDHVQIVYVQNMNAPMVQYLIHRMQLLRLIALESEKHYLNKYRITHVNQIVQ